MKHIPARDLRIGQVFGTTNNGEPRVIKALHELCVQLRTPHVHIVHTEGHSCVPFTKAVAQ